jgi:hypothetical protein
VLGQPQNCQSLYQQEVRAANDEHTKEAKKCKGESQCIDTANAKKAAALKKAGEKRYACNQTPQLKAQTPTLEPKLQWTSGPGDTSIWTDIHGKRWSFPNSRTVQGEYGPLTYKLNKSSVQLYESGGVPISASAEYREISNRKPPLRSDGARVP